MISIMKGLLLVGLASFAGVGYAEHALLQEKPVPPQHVAAVKYTSGEVDISWREEPGRLTAGFKVYRRSTAGEWLLLEPDFIPAPAGVMGKFNFSDRCGDDEWPTYRIESLDAWGRVAAAEVIAVSGFKPLQIIAAKPVATNIQSIGPNDVGLPLKIQVKDPGLYYLSGPMIAVESGLSTNEVKVLLSKSGLRLSSQGRRVAYAYDHVRGGLFFYNPGINTVYADTNVFWLERGGGQILPDLQLPIPVLPVVSCQTFGRVTHVEEQVFPLLGTATNPDVDYWVGQFLYTTTSAATSSYEFVINDPGSGIAQFRLRMMGGTQLGIAGEHHVEVYFNGHLLGSSIWEGQVANTWTFDFPASIAVNGTNSVDLVRLVVPGVPFGYNYVDWFDVDCPCQYLAEDNLLICSSEQVRSVEVGGFSTTGAELFEIRDQAHLRRIDAATTVESGEPGHYAVSFVAAKPDRLYAAALPAAVPLVTNVLHVLREGLRSLSNQGSYVVITIDAFEDTLAPLITQRDGQGWTSRVARVDDIYNQFSWGIATPYAITDFLKFASENWAVPPKAVLLAGEGTYDYKDYLGSGEQIVPTHFAASPYGLVASDNRLADWAGDDGIPEVALGRFAVDNTNDLATLVSKTIAYDSSSGLSETNVVLLADDEDDGGDFEGSCESTVSYYPSVINIDKLYYRESAYPTAAAIRSDLLPILNSDCSVLTYFGHGTSTQLGNEGFLKVADLSSLTNANALTALLCMTCVANDFSVPDYDYFGQEFVLDPDGGAILCWAPSGLSLNIYATVLNRYWLTAAFEPGPAKTMGDICREALEASASSVPAFERNMFILLGDPATILKVVK